MKYQTVLLVLALTIAAAISNQSSGGETVTVEPKDTGAAMVNPSMGWVFHFYSNSIAHYGSKLEPSDTLDDFPGLAVIYFRLPWSLLEPKEGQFDWSLLDTAAQRWIDKNKKIALRITSCENWLRYGTPQWVQEAGAKGFDFAKHKYIVKGVTVWEPDYNDPVFLEKLDHFLAALARRYDGSPRFAFIDVGSYGVWGEGNMFQGEQPAFDVKRRHIDLYVKNFKNSLVALSDDFIGYATPGRHQPLTDYALSKGVTLRDDSIMVEPPPRSWYHAELAEAFWPLRPVVIEHEHFGTSKEHGAWNPDLLLKAVEDYHASYLTLHWWPHEFLKENRAVIDRINLRLGYRLQLRKAEWPKAVRLGEPWTIETCWANAGVAPCYPGGLVAITLKDAKGGIVSVHVDDRFDVRNLATGVKEAIPVKPLRQEIVVAKELQIGTRSFARDVKPGKCDVFVSVGTLDGTPTIGLPLDSDDGHRRYKIGSIELLARDVGENRAK